MKVCRLSDDAQITVNSALGACASPMPMTHVEEVKALMERGMKIVIARGHAVWAFAPRGIALALNVPYVAALPAALDLADYMALGGELVTVP